MNATEKSRMYEEAKIFATRNHGIQSYDGFPYDKHLQDVEDVLLEVGYDKHGYMVIAGRLHDILEDAPVSFNDLKKHFGEQVAEIVYCVTDELGRNRKERKAKTYPKIKSNPDAIVIKLADRIANITHSIKQGSATVEMYMREHSDFKTNLKIDGHAEKLWEMLEDIIDSFSKSEKGKALKEYLNK